jgi:hypothetical protein
VGLEVKRLVNKGNLQQHQDIKSQMQVRACAKKSRNRENAALITFCFALFY